MLRFNNFRALSPETSDLARDLIDNADRQRSAFMSFVSVWMAFNGWMESVTDARTDASMINALAENKRLLDAYSELMERSDFRQHVMTFSAMWPVLNVRDVRTKLGQDAFWKYSREELMDECERRGVRVQPATWDSSNVPTWPQLLKTIYAVRCNLFHGAKSPQNGRDRDLVRQSDRILRKFIDRTGCFDWCD